MQNVVIRPNMCEKFHYDRLQSRRKNPPYPPAGGGPHVAQGPHVTYEKNLVF